MEANQETELFSLRPDGAGGFYVGASRVSLDSVVYAYRRGACPEEIVQSFPSLDLTDTYAAVTFYRRRTEEVDTLLLDNQAKANVMREKIEREFPMPAALRAKLDAAIAARDAERPSR